MPSGAMQQTTGPNIGQPQQTTGPNIGQQPTQPGISITEMPNPPVNNPTGVSNNSSIQHQDAQTTLASAQDQGAQHLQLTPRGEATQSSPLPVTETQQHQADLTVGIPSSQGPFQVGPDVIPN